MSTALAFPEDFPTDQDLADDQTGCVGGEQDNPTSHHHFGAPVAHAGRVTDNRPSQAEADSQHHNAGPVQTSPQANLAAIPIALAPAGSKPASGHINADTQQVRAAGSKPTDSQPTFDPQCAPAVGPDFPADQAISDAQRAVVGGEQTEDGSAATLACAESTRPPSLADPFLALAADVLDDTERTRIANENRLRQLTRTATDADGEERGFGLDESHPDVARLAALVDALSKIEHQATLNLNRLMRQHPLGAWGKQQKGVGEKQLARLLAVIGDPYWNTLHDRPRTVSELWAYSGLHTLPAGQPQVDVHREGASGETSSAGSDQRDRSNHSALVAARRRKGQKVNWSTLAKTRAYLIAESMLKAGNRETYDKRKAATEGRVHAVPCPPCGPKGKPAEVGSPWSLKHRHVDAMRIASKALLRDLWRESKRIHEGEDS